MIRQEGRRRLAPQQKDAGASGQGCENATRHVLPALFLVRMGLPLADRQDGIEEEHALACPAHEVSVGRPRYEPLVRAQFLVHVAQGGRQGLVVGSDGKTVSRKCIGVE
jgi:hypothetical protein